MSSDGLLPQMTSYAQNGEDVVLRRALHDISAGFYVDIGSSYPETDSVTKHFYDNGWTGINVDPLPLYVPFFQQSRPNDINLCVAISDVPGSLTVYEDPVRPGNSTCDPNVAEAYRKAGISISESIVPAITLKTLFADYAKNRTIDFLKIDVEGLEEKVIAGNDWTKYRPRILVIEKYIKNIRMENDSIGGAPILLAAGYQKVLFDGLNEFWLRQEDAFRRERLAIPANILDNYLSNYNLSFRVHLSNQITRLEGEKENILRQYNEANAQRDEVIVQHDEIIAQRDEAIAQRNEAIAQRNEIIAQRDKALAQLHIVLTSRSWYVTKPLRFLVRLLRKLLGRS